MAQPCKIIGISGGSGAGKTTLANALLEHYQGDAMLVSYDRYYKRMECGNYDIPESLDTELLLEHLRSLKCGQAVDLPIYDRFKNQRTSTVEWVEPKPVIIDEGIFALHHLELLDLYHCKVSLSKHPATLYDSADGRSETFWRGAILRLRSLHISLKKVKLCNSGCLPNLQLKKIFLRN
jgi:uridine kinase